ncbi:MAG: cation:proton antiporter, partial [Myxococcales bacterium]|nr:cation:proton antiporter [Myxococcales bacterium]
FGSLVIVTGPTVIGPLVRRLRIEASTAALLEAEGVLIDPVGAITAFVVLEFVLAPDLPTSLVSLSNLGLGLGLGSLVGLLGGTLLATALRRRRFIPEGLERAVTLAFVLFLYQAADALVHESGIAAVTVA